jgi:hypothetical protein
MSSPTRSQRTPPSVRTPRGSIERTPDPVNYPENSPFRQTPNRPSRVRPRNENNNSFITPPPSRRTSFNKKSPETKKYLATLKKEKEKLGRNLTPNERSKFMEKFISNNKNKNIIKTFKVKNINKLNNPVFILTDTIFDKGNIKHVYEKEYLNKLIEKSEIPLSPTTRNPINKNYIIPYHNKNKNNIYKNFNKKIINNFDINKFKDQRKQILKYYGENKTMYDILFFKHIKGEIKVYHFDLIKKINKYFRVYIGRNNSVRNKLKFITHLTKGQCNLVQGCMYKIHEAVKKLENEPNMQNFTVKVIYLLQNKIWSIIASSDTPNGNRYNNYKKNIINKAKKLNLNHDIMYLLTRNSINNRN